MIKRQFKDRKREGDGYRCVSYIIVGFNHATFSLYLSTSLPLYTSTSTSLPTSLPTFTSLPSTYYLLPTTYYIQDGFRARYAVQPGQGVQKLPLLQPPLLRIVLRRHRSVSLYECMLYVICCMLYVISFLCDSRLFCALFFLATAV
jgi:hypothetical protein